MAALFERYEHRLGRYLAQMVRDRALAEDLLQDCFHDALRSGEDIAGMRNPEGWLFGIARNRALDALRRRRRLETAVRGLAFRRERTTESGELVALRDLLERTLSPDERSLLLLRHLHGFDSNKLAEMTGLSPEAVRQRLSRARARLLAAAETEPTEQRTP
jgi:RNA polymerase sigma-70 factor, ECF subfamily